MASPFRSIRVHTVVPNLWHLKLYKLDFFLRAYLKVVTIILIVIDPLFTLLLRRHTYYCRHKIVDISQKGVASFMDALFAVICSLEDLLILYYLCFIWQIVFVFYIQILWYTANKAYNTSKECLNPVF